MDEYDPREWEGLRKQQLQALFYIGRYTDAVKAFKIAAKHLPLLVEKGLATTEGKLTTKGEEVNVRLNREMLADYGL